jgi:hypothetical protein
MSGGRLQGVAQAVITVVERSKLGFPLTSLKPNDGIRCYRIETRRAR